MTSAINITYGEELICTTCRKEFNNITDCIVSKCQPCRLRDMFNKSLLWVKEEAEKERIKNRFEILDI